MTIFKRGNVYGFNFWCDGRRVQRSTKQGSRKVARQIEAAFRTALAKSEIGLVDRAPVPTLQRVADEEFEPGVKATFVDQPKTPAYYVNGLRGPAGFDGPWSMKLDDITGDGIAAYVRERCETVFVTNINRELQVLRRTLKLAEEWAAPARAVKVRMLPGEQRGLEGGHGSPGEPLQGSRATYFRSSRRRPYSL